MANSAAYTRIKRDLLSIVAAVPRGYVSCHADIGRHLAVQPRHVAYILANLDDIDRETLPWWRVVADGGAIGRHLRRDDQIARLKADGVPLSGVGIVQEFKDRKIANPGSPPTEPFPTAPATANGAPARSRGMKSHPGT